MSRIWQRRLLRNLYRWDIPYFAQKELGYDLSKDQKGFLQNQVDLSNSKSIICAAAGAGKTFSLAVLGIWSATVLSESLGYPYNVCILGGSQEQSRICYGYMKRFIENSEYLSDLVLGEPLKSESRFRNGGSISALAAGPKSVRGKHPDLLIVDEAAEVERSLLLAAIPRVDTSRHPRIVLASTPHIYLSYFVELWNNAEKFGYKKYSWSAIDCPWIPNERIEEAKKTLDEKTFNIEYLAKPEPLLGALFDVEDLKKATIDKAPEPMLESYTTMGIDWGFEHPTAIVVLQKQQNFYYVLKTFEFKRMKFTWLQEKIKRIYERYSVDCAFADRSHAGENERLISSGLHLREVYFSKGEKESLIANLRFKLERGLIKIPIDEERLLKELSSYTEKTKEGDDLVDALMLALKAEPIGLERKTGDVKVSVGLRRRRVGGLNWEEFRRRRRF